MLKRFFEKIGKILKGGLGKKEVLLQKQVKKRVIDPLKGVKIPDFSKNLSLEELDIFFTPEIISGCLIYCSNINKDLIDDWGMSGYEEGFIFVTEMIHDEVRSLNDLFWEKGKVLEKLSFRVACLSHFDFFPRNKYSFHLFTKSRNALIYEYLKKRLFVKSKELNQSELKQLKG